jgi:hypothetical protein
VPDCVDSLVECVSCTLVGAFRIEVRLDSVARKTLPAAQAEDREQTQAPLLLHGKGDRTRVPAEGKRSEKLEDQHFFF